MESKNQSQGNKGKNNTTQPDKIKLSSPQLVNHKQREDGKQHIDYPHTYCSPNTGTGTFEAYNHKDLRAVIDHRVNPHKLLEEHDAHGNK